jgi:hypothetical protein
MGKMAETLRVINGIVELGDIVTILSYGDAFRYRYIITGFGEYYEMPQVYYKRVHSETLQPFSDVVGSWMDYPEATHELALIFKRKYFGGYKTV